MASELQILCKSLNTMKEKTDRLVIVFKVGAREAKMPLEVIDDIVHGCRRYLLYIPIAPLSLPPTTQAIGVRNEAMNTVQWPCSRCTADKATCSSPSKSGLRDVLETPLD